MNDSERVLSDLSKMRFYKELVLDNLRVTEEGTTEKEIADLLINGIDFIIAIQLKARNEQDQTDSIEKELKWLTNKCKAAKKQVKESISSIRSGNLPSLENGRKRQVYLSASAEIVPLVIFMNENIGDNYPHVLYKHSEDGMDINCMSFQDFQKICRALLSPMEIVEYLKWRLTFYKTHGDVNVSIYMDDKENITLVKPSHGEALCYQFVAENYGRVEDQELEQCIEGFTDFLHNLPDKVVVESEHNGSYPLLLFFAHFNRIEIVNFAKRLRKTLDAAQKGDFRCCASLRNTKQHYTIVFFSTHDSYVFNIDIPDQNVLEQIINQMGVSDFDILLEVVCYWENSEDYHIDFGVTDKKGRYIR